MRFEGAAVAAALFAALLLNPVGAPAAHVEPEAIDDSPVVFIHGEKSPPGSLMNESLELPETLHPAALIQIGNDVYLDADGDGNAEMVVAHAHHDRAGRIVAGLAPDAADADEAIFGAEQRGVIVAGLRGLARQFDTGRLSESDYRIAQSRWLVGLQAGTFGVTGGLSFLLELWDEGLISPLCYGIKRHELLDAL